MNGSKSSDDLGIVKYEWLRDGTSLAIGSIVGNTDHEPVLIVSIEFIHIDITPVEVFVTKKHNLIISDHKYCRWSICIQVNSK